MRTRIIQAAAAVALFAAGVTGHAIVSPTAGAQVMYGPAFNPRCSRGMKTEALVSFFYMCSFIFTGISSKGLHNTNPKIVRVYDLGKFQVKQEWKGKYRLSYRCAKPSKQRRR